MKAEFKEMKVEIKEMKAEVEEKVGKARALYDRVRGRRTPSPAPVARHIAPVMGPVVSTASLAAPGASPPEPVKVRNVHGARRLARVHRRRQMSRIQQERDVRAGAYFLLVGAHGEQSAEAESH